MTKIEKISKKINDVLSGRWLSGRLWSWTRGAEALSIPLAKGSMVHIDLPDGLKLALRSHSPSNGGIVYFIEII